MENRAGLEPELAAPLLLVVDLRARHVRGQQVRGELDAAEVGLQVLGQGLDRPGLREAGKALDEQVAVGEQADDEPLHHGFLADDGALHALVERLNLFVGHGVSCFPAASGSAARRMIPVVSGSSMPTAARTCRQRGCDPHLHTDQPVATICLTLSPES
jgi:hypothetical protein